MIFNVTGGGGTSLNFKVVGGTTQPTSPKENTIWVKTAIDIPYWTTASSAKAPAYVAQKGTVTFWWESATSTEVSGTTSTGFMPIKYKATNPPGYMRLKPINCYQNQDGTAAGWKSMDAYIYKGGEWVQFSSTFDGYLFNYGSVNEGVTGGWATNNVPHASGYGDYPTAASQSDGSIKLTMADTNKSGMYVTKNKIDLSKYSTITFKGYTYDYNGYGRGALQVMSAIGSLSTQNVVAQFYKNSRTVETHTIDVSSLTGSYYIGFRIFLDGEAQMCSLKIS